MYVRYRFQSSLAKHLSQVAPAHTSVVWPCVGLELFSTRKSADDHWLEACIPYESRCGLQSLVVITSERDTHLVDVTMRLTLKHLEVNSVERFHPTCAWKHRGSPTGRPLRMRICLARHLPVALLVRIAGIQ